MKNFFEKLKDILYDGIDYIIMILVVVVVVLVINWRLNGLFTEDATATPPNPPSETQDSLNSDKDKPSSNTAEDKNNEDDGKAQDIEEGSHNENIDSLIKINIPPGSLPSKIGEILASNGLVKDKNEFVAKAIELNLETKLKYGEFEIKKDSSMEEILEILTK